MVHGRRATTEYRKNKKVDESKSTINGYSEGKSVLGDFAHRVQWAIGPDLIGV
jgi:hypothetical protein